MIGLINNDKKVASFKNHAQFKTGVQKPDPIYDQNGWKTTLFGASHTYIAHTREYSPLPQPGILLSLECSKCRTSNCHSANGHYGLPTISGTVYVNPFLSRVQVSSRTVLSRHQSRKRWPRDGEQRSNGRTNTTNERLGTVPHIAKKRFTDVASINFTILVFYSQSPLPDWIRNSRPGCDRIKAALRMSAPSSNASGTKVMAACKNCKPRLGSDADLRFRIFLRALFQEWPQ